jgi:predicted nucleic acid-binding protein
MRSLPRVSVAKLSFVIILDTNVLYATADRRDAHDQRCTSWVTNTRERLLVPPTVVAETCYLIDRSLGPKAEATFLDVGVGSGYPYQLVDLVHADVRRMAELVRQYADRRLGGTDASVVALAERLKVTTVATVNARDFANVRPRHVRALRLVPN